MTSSGQAYTMADGNDWDWPLRGCSVNNCHVTSHLRYSKSCNHILCQNCIDKWVWSEHVTHFFCKCFPSYCPICTPPEASTMNITCIYWPNLRRFTHGPPKKTKSVTFKEPRKYKTFKESRSSTSNATDEPPAMLPVNTFKPKTGWPT